MLPTANMSTFYPVVLLLLYVSINKQKHCTAAQTHTHVPKIRHILWDINKCILTIFPCDISSALLRTNICPVMEVLLLIINGPDKIVSLVYSLSGESNCTRKSVASEIMNKLAN